MRSPPFHRTNGTQCRSARRAKTGLKILLWGTAGVLVLGVGASQALEREVPAGVVEVVDERHDDAAGDLGGTSWQLVRFEGGDDTVVTPDDKAKYTIAFGADGRVSVRIDCNRGTGTWRSSGRNQIEFGPLALTRAMCPPGSMHDQLVKHWEYFRSYVIKDGRLFLSLMADGGIYEFEPSNGSPTPQ
jgi:heat shock protein HslJ